MESALSVSALILWSGGLLFLSRWTERFFVRKQTRAAFEARHRARDHPSRWTPMRRFHPMYADGLRQIGSKRTAKKLESQQWGFAGLALVLVYTLTGNWTTTLLVATFAFAFPILQLRSGVKRAARDVAAEMRKMILLLRIYVTAGKSNLHAVSLVQPHLKGRLKAIVHDAETLMGHMTFEEVMQLLANESPSEELEMVAKALKQGAKHGSEVSENLSQALDEMNHRDQLQLGKFKEQQKRKVYMKFMLFFVTPLILDVMLYVWGMFGVVSHTF